ncbi:GNAT family N-acetyltransferase [Ferruginibacter sp.]|uniref:GNAT family N-acetyltransferase n=1 Tax=Ferruginibacter sp. TaxID=1940288 RepID=UPI00265B31AA|nr:GNAT family N-acetyltransferase [Ferruginibacter sp.]
MDNIKIREANESDLTVLIEFEQEIIKAERAFDNSLKEGEIHYHNFQNLIASPNAKVIVAEIENEIVGSGYAEIKEAEFYLKHSEYAYLGLMYVKPKYRGKGINQQVLQTLKKWIVEKKITEIRLVVYDANILAKNAFQKEGWKPHVLEMRMGI